jgi:hypothetical protein
MMTLQEVNKAAGAKRSPSGQDAQQGMIVPARAEDLADHYDLTISHPAVDQIIFACFDRWLARSAAARGLACALIHDGIVHEAIRRLAAGELTIGFHLDYFALWHVPEDPYARLAQAVQDSGGRPVNAPARSRLFTDKAAAHLELARHGLGVPESIILRPWTADRKVTTDEWQRLRLDEPGAFVYVKPANGYGGRGVHRIPVSTPDALTTAIASARNSDRRETYLVQREVRCVRFRCDDGVTRPAYWRVLHCLGDFLVFWWNGHEAACGRPAYREVTLNEVYRLELQPLYEAAEALADLCGLEWFSTEFCLSEGGEPSRFMLRGADGLDRPLVVIDYVNDQCDVDVQSRCPGAPPDAIVAHLAERFAETAARRSRLLTPSALRLAA